MTLLRCRGARPRAPARADRDVRPYETTHRILKLMEVEIMSVRVNNGFARKSAKKIEKSSV